MDHAIAQAYFGAKYMFHPVQKAIRYKLTVDFPIPDYIAVWSGGEWDTYMPKGMNSSYTKWWPNVFAVGYRLTGEKMFKDTCMDVVWWGLNRTYTNAPHYPEGEAPKYSRVINNTKGDWMTPTCLAFGIVAFPKKEEVAPPAVTDLAVEAKGDGKVVLTWTAPGDEGGGTPMRYQVKWAEKPLVGYIQTSDEYRAHFKNGALDVTYWTFATNVAGEPAPQKKGAKETMTLSVPAGKTLYFGVRMFDDSHNRSPMSNVARNTGD